MQEQLLDISKELVLEHRLQSCSMRMIQQSSDSISRECRTDSGTHFSSGIISLRSFFIVQSELSDQQRERLTSALSLRNISRENYSYEMLKTHYHELFITTRTSIQDPSIRPQGGNRSNTFFIIEQGEYDGEEGFWVEDEEGLEGFMSNNDEETFWVLEENDAIQQTAPSTEPTYAGWTDQDWDQSWTWNEQGWYSSHETSSTGQALMAFHDAYEHHEKDAIHGKLIQSDAVSEHNLSVTTNCSLLATKLMAPVINPQHNPTYAILDNGCTRSMGSWHAIQRFTQAIEPMKDIISYQYIPAETKFTFANGETARVTALTHVPTGRDALLILAFLKDRDYDIRLSDERTALTDQTIEARNIVTAFDSEGTIIMSNSWIMKKISVVKTLRCTTARSKSSPTPSSHM